MVHPNTFIGKVCLSELFLCTAFYLMNRLRGNSNDSILNFCTLLSVKALGVWQQQNNEIEDMQCLNIHRGQKVDGERLIEIV